MTKVQLELSGEHEATLLALCGLYVNDDKTIEQVAQRLMEMQLEAPVWEQLIKAQAGCQAGIDKLREQDGRGKQ